MIAVGIIVVLVVAIVNGHTDQPVVSPPTQSGSPTVLAPVDSTVGGSTTDGIQCGASESVLFHIHAHLAVYVNGQARIVPEGIGITPPRQETQSGSGPFVTSGTCFYWLHSHTADGIIHIESPVQRTFTLGDYFDIWGQPLSASQVGPATGTLIAYVNGTRYNGDPRAIALTAHALVQLDVGQDVAPQPFAFPAGL